MENETTRRTLTQSYDIQIIIRRDCHRIRRNCWRRVNVEKRLKQNMKQKVKHSQKTWNVSLRGKC